MSSPPIPSHRVLPTLNSDGTRRRIDPRLYPGKLLERRTWVAWGLIVLFVALPFVRIGERPALLFDVLRREFTFFGRTFFATDGALLMLLLLLVFVGIVGVTALVGRAFCGWACPQTVYLEFVFRPLERLIEGDRSARLRRERTGGKARRAIKHVVFGFLALALANVFLAYFVGVERLGRWATSSPLDEPEGFAVMAVTAGLVFFDFASFREQMCTVACPYARLQSALVDRDSLVIGYDARRGEPRKKGKPGVADCIDCGACVATCPTGIDIRDGLQLECIACGQCVDACNTIMPKIGRPLGLIRYASANSLSGGRTRVLRPRVVVYLVVLVLLLVTLVLSLRDERRFDVTVLRGRGAPYAEMGDRVRNQLRIKVENRTSEAVELSLDVTIAGSGAASGALELVAPENPFRVDALGRVEVPAFVTVPRAAFERGRIEVLVRVRADGVTEEVPYTLVGPTTKGRNR